MSDELPTGTAVEERRDWPSWIRGAVGGVVGLLIVAYLVNLLWGRRAELERVWELDSRTIWLLFVLVLASILQRTLELEFLFRRLGARETFLDGFLLTSASLLLNYLPFSAGSVARAVVLRRRYGLSYSSYVAALTMATLMNAGVAALAGLAACLYLLPQYPAAAPFAAFCAAVSIAVAGALFVPARWVPASQTFVLRVARRVLERVAHIRGRGIGLLVLTGTSLIKLSVTMARLWLCFRALNTDLSLVDTTLVGSAALLASVVNLVPSNIGLRELVLGAVANVLGESGLHGLAAASLDRAVIFSCTLIVGLLGVRHSRWVLRASAGSATPTPATSSGESGT
jgi:uncharacterized membrane protein YbhN (UPF0104 family)